MSPGKHKGEYVDLEDGRKGEKCSENDPLLKDDNDANLRAKRSVLGHGSCTDQTGSDEPLHRVHVRQHDFPLPHNDGRDDGRSTVQDSPLHEHNLQDARRRDGRHLGFRPEGILFNSTSHIFFTFLPLNVQH